MGKLVSLSGVNGVGKSTQVEIIRKKLLSMDKSVLVTQQLFRYFLLVPIIKLLKPSSGSSSGPAIKKNKRIILKIWFVLAFVDIWIGYLVKISPLVKKYDYVIADRDYGDLWISILYYGFMPRWAFKPLIGLLPKADVNFLFIVQSKNVEKRETGFPKQYYSDQIRLYKMVVNKKNTVIIDANRSKKEVSKIVLSALNKI